MNTDTTPDTTETESEPTIKTDRATYEPESNKLRLYVGRVPREEYLKLKAEGWTALHKQREAGGGDFAATWTPERRRTALRYADIIEDEDMSVMERAADRAERFGGYRDKRTDEATGHADRYDSGPQVHGYQSQARAERAAKRHDRIADRAGDAWDKAEYWQRRTAGVISNALYKSTPSVRMGRIKELEAALRKCEKSWDEYAKLYADMHRFAAMTDAEEQTKTVRQYLSQRNVWADYMHPRAADHPSEYRRTNKMSLYSLISDEQLPITGAEACALFLSDHSEPEQETEWMRHYKLRLAYENQMLEAQGGRAGVVEMVPGGWLISGTPGYRRFRDGDEERQIIKVNKSTVTGRVVSVLVRDNHPSSVNHWGNPYPDGVTKTLVHTVNVERAGPDCYRPPTPEELATFLASEKAAKKQRKETGPAPIPLINPTDEDAERLQAIWNADTRYRIGNDNGTVTRMTQTQYSAVSKGTYRRAEAKLVAAGGKEPRSRYGQLLESAVCKVRFINRSVIVLTDKPRASLPASTFNDPTPQRLEIVQKQFKQLMEIHRLLIGSYSDTESVLTKTQQELFTLARLVGYAYDDSISQRGITPTAYEWARSNSSHLVTA